MTRHGRSSTAVLIAVPCFFALVAYDYVAIEILNRGSYQLVPAHDLARAILQDLGLTAVYAGTVPFRVHNEVAGYSARTRWLCLAMLGLGLAWYDVLCAFGTRYLADPPGIGVSLVILFIVPVLLAPWYVRWLKSKVPEG
jgi:hypothetical protein